MIDLDGLEEVEATIHYNPALGSGSASYKTKLEKSEWKQGDRACACRTFASAAKYNTDNLNSSVYKPVNQIHQYYVWAVEEIDKKKANIKFFKAAEAVTSLMGVDGAYTFPGIVGLSEHGQKSLADVNSRVLKENMPVIRDIINTDSSSAVNGKGIIWDFNFVKREQNAVTEVITKDPLSAEDQAAINKTFKNFEFFHGEYKMAKALIGVDKIDYKQQNHREAIGRSLVFIMHFLDANNYQKSSETPEFKSSVDYLNKEYGETNTRNFFNTYRNTYGQ